ncbi:hypothetical protein C8T65DRAFT_667572 [Cerioporus squamosus]|nr:hypothetical protein C8T65DRAFT_667572 [Cerioporus squamosus]
MEQGSSTGGAMGRGQSQALDLFDLPLPRERRVAARMSNKPLSRPSTLLAPTRPRLGSSWRPPLAG